MTIDLLCGLRSVQVFRVDRAGSITACNDAACDGLGLARERIEDHPIQQFLTSTDAGSLDAILRAGGTTDQPVRLNFSGAAHVPYTLDTWVEPADGGWLVVGESPGQHDQRQQRELMEVNQELAVLARERAKSVQRERQARAAADSANNAKDNAVATIVHELRQPLGPMRLAVELIRKSTEEDTRARALAILDRQIGHLTRLFQDLLEVSRIQQGKLSLTIQPADLPALVREAADAFRARADAGGIALTVTVPDAPLVLPLDATRLTQVVSNLLENALKFSAPGGKIEVEVIEQPEGAQVVIRDTGRGIAPDVLPHIFQLFAQQRHGEGGGLGIGLAISRAIVAQHQGRIDVSSAGVNRGATFTVSLPADAEDRAR